MELPNSLCWTFHYHQAHYNSVAWYYQQMNMVEQLGKAFHGKGLTLKVEKSSNGYEKVSTFKG